MRAHISHSVKRSRARAVGAMPNRDGRLRSHLVHASCIGFGCAVAAALLAPASSGAASTIERVTLDAEGRPFSSVSSGAGAMSSTGRFVAIYVTWNNNRVWYVKDRASGAVDAVNVNSDGIQANGNVYDAVVSGDGRFVVFESDATNLVPDDTNDQDDVFLRDRFTGRTTRLSVSSTGQQANRACANPDMSADGRYIVFSSLADNLVSGDTNGENDSFLHDRVTGSTTRISLTADGSQLQAPGANPSISADGRFVTFDTDDGSFSSGGGNQVVRRELSNGECTVISVGTDGRAASGFRGVVSGDGRFVLFSSSSSDLVPGDSSTLHGLFVRDAVAGTTSRVSVTSQGAAVKPGTMRHISDDGRLVVFTSDAPNVVDGVTGDHERVYLHDRAAGTTTLVSAANDGTPADAACSAPQISPDGRHVSFSSIASNLVADDLNRVLDGFVVSLDGATVAPPRRWSIDDQYSFHNFVIAPSAVDWQLFESVFGASAVKSRAAREYFKGFKNDFENGVCYGMAATAGMFYRGRFGPTPQSFGAETVRGIQRTASSGETDAWRDLDEPIERHIAKYSYMQYDPDVRKAVQLAFDRGDDGIQEVADAVELDVADYSRDPYMLNYFWTNRHGHSVNVIGTERLGDALALDVYDNNYGFAWFMAAEPTSILQRYSFQSIPNLFPGDTIARGHVRRVSVNEREFVAPPWRQDGRVVAVASAGANFVQTDSAGRRVGMVGGTEIVEIPGAEVVVPLTGLPGEPASNPRVQVSAPVDTYSVEVSSTAPGVEEFALFAEGVVGRVEVNKVAPDLATAIEFNPEAAVLTVNVEGDDTPIAASLVEPLSVGADRSIAVDGVELDTGEDLVVAPSMATGGLSVSLEGPPRTCDLKIGASPSDTGSGEINLTDVALSPETTTTVDLTDWSAVNESAVLVIAEHGDGRIEVQASSVNATSLSDLLDSLVNRAATSRSFADGVLSLWAARNAAAIRGYLEEGVRAGRISSTDVLCVTAVIEEMLKLPAPPSVATNLSLRVSVVQPAYGAPSVVSGRLTRATTAGGVIAGQRVQLQRGVASGWARVADATTGSSGEVAFTVRPAGATTYRLRFEGAPGRFEPKSSIVATVRPKTAVGAPVAPKTMRRGKAYTVYGSLKPRHASGTKPVRIYKYKKVGGNWKSYGYVKATASNYSAYSRYKVKMKLTSKGKWRLRAYAPADSLHAATWSTKYDYVTVK